MRNQINHLIYFIILLSFSGLIFDLIPGGRIIQSILLVMCILILLSRSTHSVSKEFSTLIAIYSIYLSYHIFSSLNVSSIFNTIFITNKYIIGLLVLIWVAKEPQIIKFNRFFWFKIVSVILIIQFIASCIKFNLSGFSEGFMIGTMATGVGQLAFLVPIIFIPILVYFIQYSSNKKNKLIFSLLIFFMFLIGLINNKRSTIYLMPVILFLSLSFLSKSRFSILNIKNIIIYIVILVTMLKFTATFSPELSSSIINFSYIQYLTAFAYEYIFMDYGSGTSGTLFEASINNNVQVGRLVILREIIHYISNSDISTFLFGIGSGLATPNEWLGVDRDILFRIVGVRGAYSTFGLHILETGIIGVFLLIVLIIKIIQYNIYCVTSITNKKLRDWAKVVLIGQIIFCYDIFFYSTTLFKVLPLPLLYFGMIASLYKIKLIDRKYNL